MAPLAAEPRQMLVVLNAARRRALYQLVDAITAYMRSQLELHDDQEPASASPSPRNPGDAPLFPVPPPGSDDGAEVDAPAAPRPALVALRKAALAHLGQWSKDFLAKLREMAAAPDDAKVLGARKKRADRIAQMKLDTPRDGESLIDFGEPAAEGQAQTQDAPMAHPTLQHLYHPIPTRLTTIPMEDRKEVLSCVLLLLLSSGHYSAYSRALAMYLTSALELPLSVLVAEETEIAKSLVETSAAAENQMSADAEAQRRKQEGQVGRYWKVGLASVAGAAVIGITGGLAAPVVAGAIGGLMGSVGLGGVASFLGIFWMNGALVGTLFGAFGARMTGEMMDQYAREVEDFRFLPLRDEWGKEYRRDDKDFRRLRVTIGINGWLTSKEDVTRPWRALSDDSEVFALRFEMASLLSLGTSLEGLVESYAWSYIKMEILKRTVLATLWSALWPAYLLQAAAGIDNPFSLARNRAEKAGRILADALVNRAQGERPVTLVGYSLGARVVYACLRSLAERRAFGLVDSAVFIGAPIPSNREHWLAMRSVVAGHLFNVYSENDCILAFLYRATSVQLGIAGLQEVAAIDGVENLDLSREVEGHLRYPGLIPQILTRCGFPDVKGGEGPIEREEESDVVEAIRLQETAPAGSDAMGTLIELGDLPAETPPPPPPRPDRPTRQEAAVSSSNHLHDIEPTTTANPTSRPQRTNQTRKVVVTRSRPDALAQELDPLRSPGRGEEARDDDDGPLSRPPPPPRQSPSTANAAAPAPVIRQQTTPSQLKTASKAAAERPPPPHKTESAPPPTIVSSFDGYARRHRVEDEVDDDDDDDGHVGISMVDNDDDMVTYDEPLVVED